MVVAVVPTSRGRDFDDLVSACGALQEKTSAAPDCAGVRALAESARANVENNVFAVLLVGSLGLVAAVIFMVLDRRREQDRRRKQSRQQEQGHQFSWPGFVAAAAVVVAGWLAFYRYRTGVVHNAHWVAALSLFACIFVVAFENARGQQVAKATDSVLRRAADFYTWIATALLVIGVISLVAWWRHWITLFWLEIIVFFLFIAFWIAQTVEQDGKPPGTEPVLR